MSEACHEMLTGEVLNAAHSEYPLYKAVLYGDRVLTAKFSKRLSCAIKHLPLRLAFSYEYDVFQAMEQGIEKDPTLLLDGKIFLEGLVQAEEITKAFENIISSESKGTSLSF